MERWLPLMIFGLLMGGLMIALSRYQSRKYQQYLSNHVAVNEKMRENQEHLIEQQERSLAVAERNVATLERIAMALEKRG